ncbi:serpin family protein [Hymenobacter busanensis]|uniref:Serpin family protein n=1 Tax=Hymenobacter busanensis TaxID=2607656 RepID=A0A7L4ZW83_9BACT|nr:serpin family protein [Hymenobacter busanensis]KAA9339133.1 serpin family protein [Hymenobacter busanensis]QHJ07105.1 serpin family protein [Hymenobacter busanensis]
MNLTLLRTATVAVASAALLTACHKETAAPAEADNAPNLRPLTTQETKTVGSANDFAFRSFGRIQAAAPADNVFISPLSISAALTMTYNGADGSTKTAIRETLGFAPLTDDEINESYQSLVRLLSGIDRTVTFTSANSLWHSQRYQLQAPFIQKNTTYFDAKVQGLNFSDAAGSLSAINGWVEQKTNGKIKDLVKEVTPSHVLFLINAIYFKGSWTTGFDKQLTRTANFTLPSGSFKPVDMMLLRNGQYAYYQDATKQVVDLPYGNRQYSMTLVLPKGTATVQDIARDLSSQNLSAWLGAASTSSLDLYLPKFRMEYEIKLNETLKQLGMGVAFTGQANFSRMLVGQDNLAISEVMHKSFVDVDESGTEAAAATSVGIVTTSVPPSVRFDRPFVFLIREKSSNAILFIGQLTNP